MLNFTAVIHSVADYVRQHTAERVHFLFFSTSDANKKSELKSCELQMDNKATVCHPLIAPNRQIYTPSNPESRKFCNAQIASLLFIYLENFIR
jgi:hypothetical protein